MRNRLVFGAGALHRIVAARRRQRVLETAYDAGIRAFDLAPAYGNGINETEVGLALRGRRDGCEINTKYGIPTPVYGPAARHVFALRRLGDRLIGASAKAYRRRDFSAHALEASLEGSLTRLRTDYVDALFLHEPIGTISSAQWDEILECAGRMRSSGKIKALGIAGPLASARLCPSLEGVEILQVPWTDREAAAVSAPGRTRVLFGAFRAYLAAEDRTDFTSFVRRALDADPRTSVIVSSGDPRTIRTFREIPP